jgi:hypothetical protein
MIDETNQQEQIIVRAWEDEEFKQNLVSNPKAAIEQELGEKFPEGVEVRVLQETANTRYLVLPPANLTAEERQEVLQQLREGEAGAFSALIIRSIEDDAFRQELLSQPNTVIERELGITLPEGTAVRVVEEERNIRYLVLPQRPDSLEDDELSEEALEAVAGGGDVHVKVCLCTSTCRKTLGGLLR